MGTFSDAMKVLHKVQTWPRPAKIPSASTVLSARKRMENWLRVLQIYDAVQAINWIHVAGSKGKGTTCLYANAIVCQWVKLRENVSDSDLAKSLKYLFAEASIPGFPGFLTLLGFYVFAYEKVDIGIIETGIGGETDSSNIVEKPCATGITAIGYDHVNVLGNTISSIAWHKGGIFKRDVPAFTVEQEEADATSMLRARSLECSVAGTLEEVNESIALGYGVEVYPAMPYQQRNASLAIALISATLRSLDPSFTMTKSLAQSLTTAELPGRNEIISARNIWLISVSHNEMSIKVTSSWFRQVVTAPEHAVRPLVVIFSQHASHRDAEALLKIFYNEVFGDGDRVPELALFCTDCSGIEDTNPDLFDSRRNQASQLIAATRYAKFWSEFVEGSVQPVATVREAVDIVNDRFVDACVIVVGGLYLAGAVRAIVSKGS